MKIRLALSMLPLATAALAQPPSCPVDRAVEAVQKGDPAAAADLFELATRCGATEARTYYDAACAAALAGRKDAAVDFLEQAVAQGYHDAEHLAADTDLSSLHGDPRWPGLVASVEEAKRRNDSLWGGKAFASAYRETLTEDEKVAGLSVVWAEARSNFAFFDQVPDLDWDAAYLEWLPRVRAARSTAEYYRELQALVAKLGDGHTGVSYPRELRPYFWSRPALETELVEGRVFVAAVLDPALEAKGIAPGAEILEIDGEPVEAYAAARVRPYQSASTPQDLDTRVYRQDLLRGAEGTRVRLRLEDPAGGRREVELERLSPAGLWELAPRPADFEITPLGDGFLRIDLRSFNSEEVFTRWKEHWPEIAAARGLVLDVRENGGGNSLNGWNILATLVDRPFAVSAWKSRRYVATFRAWDRGEGWYLGSPGFGDPDPEMRYAGPVAVLIGPRTYSAAEDFLVAFDVAGRGDLVGEATGGSTGQPLFVPLPGGGSVRICTKRDTYPDGKEFVGVGIQPTVAVSRTVADLRAGHDAALEAAVDRLRARLASGAKR